VSLGNHYEKIFVEATECGKQILENGAIAQIAQWKPWLLDIWEPLFTKAPCPDKTRPYCCLYKVVIFYVGPRHVVRPWHHFWNCNGILRAEKPGHHYEEWDRVEYALSWNDVVRWNGETFEVGGGRVIWRNNRWWMRHSARRVKRPHSAVPPKG
jgi:hypothetical protein